VLVVAAAERIGDVLVFKRTDPLVLPPWFLSPLYPASRCPYIVRLIHFGNLVVNIINHQHIVLDALDSACGL